MFKKFPPLRLSFFDLIISLIVWGIRSEFLAIKFNFSSAWSLADLLPRSMLPRRYARFSLLKYHFFVAFPILLSLLTSTLTGVAERDLCTFHLELLWLFSDFLKACLLSVNMRKSAGTQWAIPFLRVYPRRFKLFMPQRSFINTPAFTSAVLLCEKCC